MFTWLAQSLGIILLTLPALFAMEMNRLETWHDLSHIDQVKLNIWVSQQGMDVYRLLNNDSKFGYPGEDKYYTDSQLWQMSLAYGEPTVSLIKVQGIPASLALLDLLSKAGRFDCRIAQRIVFLECVRRLVGNEIFDLICQEYEKESSEGSLDFAGSTKVLIIDGPMYANPYLGLASFERGTLFSVNKVGYFGYTPNIPQYARIHPKGDLRGDHGLLCSGTADSHAFAGYGAFYKQNPQPWEEMRKRFKQETLTFIPPSEIVIDTSDIREDRKAIYIKQMKALHESDLERKRTLVSTLSQTYEQQFEFIQDNFNGAKTFYIDLNKVKKVMFKSSNCQRLCPIALSNGVI